MYFFQFVFLLNPFIFVIKFIALFFNRGKVDGMDVISESDPNGSSSEDKASNTNSKVVDYFSFSYYFFVSLFFHYIFCSCSIFDILICTTFFSADILLFCSC